MLYIYISPSPAERTEVYLQVDSYRSHHLKTVPANALWFRGFEQELPGYFHQFDFDLMYIFHIYFTDPNDSASPQKHGPIFLRKPYATKLHYEAHYKIQLGQNILLPRDLYHSHTCSTCYLTSFPCLKD